VRLNTFLLALSLIISNTFASTAQFPCVKWNDVKTVGELPGEEINESSGMVASSIREDLIYHINDSGDGPFVYMTNTKGEFIQKTAFQANKPRDLEDLTRGSFQGKPALFFPDIGDNRETRPRISLYIVAEEDLFKKQTSPLASIDLTYPDGSHDAEAIAVANGKVFVVTKKVDWSERRAISAGVYAIDIEKLENHKGPSRLMMEKVFELNLPYLLYNYNLWGRIVTAMDVHPEGQSFALLTYGAILVVNKDLGKVTAEESDTKKWKEKVDYTIIRTPSTPQQEALAYSADGSKIFFSTEYKKRFGNPLYEVTCKERLTVNSQQ
jgi:hypothetical protein